MSIESESNPPQILIYETDDKIAKVSVRLVDESLWLTNLQLAHLFQVSKSTVSEHIKSILDGGELSPDSVVRNFRTTAADGKSYDMLHPTRLGRHRTCRSEDLRIPATDEYFPALVFRNLRAGSGYTSIRLMSRHDIDARQATSG